MCLYICSLPINKIVGFADYVKDRIEDSHVIQHSSLLEEDEKDFLDKEVRIAELHTELVNQNMLPLTEGDVPETINNIASLYNLNLEQQLALKLAGKSLHEQTFFILCGEAGTGKSKTLESMTGLFKAIGQGNNIIASGTTGVSSARLKCKTIHSLCGWRYKRGALEDEYSYGITALRKLLPSSLKLLLIDEVSMLDAGMLESIDRTFKLVFKKRSLPFGGISICFSGDFYQLPPVGGCSLMKDLHTGKRRRNEIRDSVIWGIDFWRKIENVVILQQNYRQTDPVYLRLLRNWKNGRMTPNDWNLLRSRVLRPNLIPESTKIAAKDVYCIVKYNDTKNALNNAVAAVLQKPIINLRAHDSCSTVTSLDHMDEYLKEINDNRSHYLSGNIPLFIGAQIVFTYNYNPTIGVAKGTRGIVTNYDSEKDQVIVRLSSRIRSFEEAQNLGIGVDEYIVKRVKISFKLDEWPGHTIRRAQFGMDLGYCVTDYKSQGETVNQAFVDISEGNYASIYVMLSRVRSLDGLFLLKSFSADEIDPMVPVQLVKEMNRLEVLFRRTKQKHGQS